MVSNEYKKWIRIFDIPETSKHKKGFTIYKIRSMLYPLVNPDAITEINVWKRFNDLKKLHREMKVLHRNLNIKDRFPSLSNASFFKRFDDEVIQERRNSILNFLEYVGSHQQLFLSNTFVKFFETSHTPAYFLNSKINSIRADLNLPEDPDITFISSDEECSISDTDSVSTFSSLSPSVQTDTLTDPFNRTMSLKLPRALGGLSTDQPHRFKNTLEVHNSACSSPAAADVFNGHIYPTPPNTPGSSIIFDNPAQYIIDATEHVNLATEYEISGKYSEAFSTYKAGIDILLTNVKSDKNYDRKQMVRYKIEKYLLRAEKIYNMHLSPDIKNINEITKVKEQQSNQNCVSDLYKYKVLKVIASGMLVLHTENQKMFYIKVVHKTTKFLNDNLLLPDNVPYMVKLYNYYNCENAVFLVLEYCSGIKLWDYIKETNSNQLYNTDSSGEVLTTDIANAYESDNESVHSYSDLINDYTYNKSKEVLSNSDSATGDMHSENSIKNELMEELSGSINEANDIISKSQQLLSSVELTLKTRDDTVNDKTESKIVKQDTNVNKKMLNRNQRTSSDRSLFEDFDCVRNFIIPIENVIKWAAQLILALEKLHKFGVICCDLQSKNLLIDQNGNLLLTYMSSINQMQDIFGCEGDTYLAPEIYMFQEITPAVDWWGFGVILYELLVGESLKVLHPEGLNSYSLLKIPSYISREGRSLLKQLLTFEPRDRLGCGINGAEDIKSHPFFSTICWESLSKDKN